jgi:putative NADPH-quinone reductase
MPIEVAHLDFPILRTREEFETDHLPEGSVDAQRAIVSVQHLVMIFPLWHGTMPALLKAVIEQVMRPGSPSSTASTASRRGYFAGRPAWLVVTMGMSALIYRWYCRAHGVRGP